MADSATTLDIQGAVGHGSGMKLYLDEPRFRRARGRKSYAHLTANSMLELEEAAERLGLRLQQKTTRPHLDVPVERVAEAEALGASRVSSRRLAEFARELAARWPEERRSRGYKWCSRA